MVKASARRSRTQTAAAQVAQGRQPLSLASAAGQQTTAQQHGRLNAGQFIGGDGPDQCGQSGSQRETHGAGSQARLGAGPAATLATAKPVSEEISA